MNFIAKELYGNNAHWKLNKAQLTFLCRNNYTKEETARILNTRGAHINNASKSLGLSFITQGDKTRKRVRCLIDEGHTVLEICELLNIRATTVYRATDKRLGVKNPNRECKVCGKKFIAKADSQMYCSLQCQRKYINKNGGTTKTLEEIYKWVSLYKPHLEYVSGYKNIDSRITVKCKKCGFIFTLRGSSIRNRNQKCECPECVKREREEKQRRERLANIKITHINTSGMKVLDIRYCKECGKMFEAKGNAKYCSNACRKRVANRSHDHRIKPEAMVDKDITLKRLAERDNNICHICGLPVDWHDDYNGKYYPSIDHVVPLAKGGLHSWQNVKLAHRQCNTIKSDKVVV